MGLDVNIVGNNNNISTELQIDPTFQAARVNLRATEFQGYGRIGGHFFLSATFASTAAALSATSQILSLRWADTGMLFLLKRVAISCALSTNFAAIQVCDYDIIKATSFSANPSGGTAITPATTANKARSATMSGSLLSSSGALQVSSGGPLSAGTQTLDTQPFGYVIPLVQSAASPVVNYSPGLHSLYELRDFGQHPMIFGANEGFAVRVVTTHGATGVVRHGIMLEWAEVPQY